MAGEHGTQMRICTAARSSTSRWRPCARYFEQGRALGPDLRDSLLASRSCLSRCRPTVRRVSYCQCIETKSSTSRSGAASFKSHHIDWVDTPIPSHLFVPKVEYVNPAEHPFGNEDLASVLFLVVHIGHFSNACIS